MESTTGDLVTKFEPEQEEQKIGDTYPIFRMEEEQITKMSLDSEMGGLASNDKKVFPACRGWGQKIFSTLAGLMKSEKHIKHPKLEHSFLLLLIFI